MNFRLRDKFLIGFIVLTILMLLNSGGGFYTTNKSLKSIDDIQNFSLYERYANQVTATFRDVPHNIQLYVETQDHTYLETASKELADVLASGDMALGKIDGNLAALNNDILEKAKSLSVNIDELEKIFENRKKEIDTALIPKAESITGKLAQISEQAMLSGNPDAAMGASSMRGHFLSARIHATKVQIKGDKASLSNFVSDMAHFKEAGEGTVAYASDKGMKDDLTALLKDQSYVNSVTSVQKLSEQILAIQKTVNEEVESINSLVDQFSAVLESKKLAIVNENATAIESFKIISLLLLIVGGGGTLILSLYLINQLKIIVGDLLAGFLKTEEAISRVNSSTHEMMDGLDRMVTSILEVGIRGQEIGERATKMSENIETVSTAVMELDQSIQQIQRTSEVSRDKVVDTVQKTGDMERIICDLTEASGQIEDVVGVINSLAEQTSLLALNATIEAARAGEAGKGFSVVADEVKKLAIQTAESTGNIRGQVDRISGVSRQALAFMNDLAGNVRDIQTNVSEVNGSVLEQQKGTSEISHIMHDASGLTVVVSDNIQTISHEIATSSAQSQQVIEQARGLSHDIQVLREQAKVFTERLTKI